MPLIVFVTAFDQYAVNAFEVHAVDYLLKPVEQPRLEEAVSRARSMAEAQNAADQKGRADESDRVDDRAYRIDDRVAGGAAQGSLSANELTIRDGNETTLVPVADIEWIDAAGDYMCIHVKNKTHVMRVTMKQLEALLDPALFLRVHRSTLDQRATRCKPYGARQRRVLHHADAGRAAEGQPRLSRQGFALPLAEAGMRLPPRRRSRLR